MANFGFTRWEWDTFEHQTSERHTKGDGFALLPAPTARDYEDAGPNVQYKRIAEHRVLQYYARAIQRWEEILGRPAPEPALEYGYLSLRRMDDGVTGRARDRN